MAKSTLSRKTKAIINKIRDTKTKQPAIITTTAVPPPNKSKNLDKANTKKKIINMAP